MKKVIITFIGLIGLCQLTHAQTKPDTSKLYAGYKFPVPSLVHVKGTVFKLTDTAGYINQFMLISKHITYKAIDTRTGKTIEHLTEGGLKAYKP